MSTDQPASPEMPSAALVANNYRRALEGVHDGLAKCGRPLDSVRVIGVTKYVDSTLARHLVAAGCWQLGESRPQALWQKAADLADLVGIEWHMIGHLQRNKVSRTLPLIGWLHSLDSLRLAETLDAEALQQSRRLRVLLEVNVTSDSSKTGLAADQVEPLMERLIACQGLEVRGLMAMSTANADLTEARREFEAVRQLRDKLQVQFGQAVQLDELSMGMSDDYQAAIEAGATMIRLGSLLWSQLL
jgi:PLP dependent protein